MSGDSIHVASTTDPQSSVDAAADYTPTESSGSTTTGVSTTDSAEEIHQALSRCHDDPAFKSGDQHAGGVGVAIGQPKDLAPRESGIRVDSTDSPEEVEQVRKEAVKEKEENRVDYLTGRGVRKRISQVIRQRNEARDQIHELERDSPSVANHSSGVVDQSPQYQLPQQPPQSPEQHRAAQEAMWSQEEQRQRSPAEPQQVVTEYQQAQVRIAEEEKAFAENHPDYPESVRRLEPGKETPTSRSLSQAMGVRRFGTRFTGRAGTK